MTPKLLFINIILSSGMAFITGFNPNKTVHQYINPTGTYQLNSKVIIRHGDTFGATGSIQIKAISKDRVIIVLGINMGAKAYNSGALIDTLIYKNNICVYHGDNDDPSCEITFIFIKTGIKVTQKQADINNGCGFGHGVFADGFYKKKSSKIPILKDPETGELIQH